MLLLFLLSALSVLLICKCMYKEKYTPNNNIPRIIHQTYISKDHVPKYVFDNLSKYSVGYEYRFYDDRECKRIIHENFEGKILDKYNSITNTAHKADIFRYCILYLYGGVYLDIKIDIQKSLDEILKRRDCVYTVLSIVPGSIFNGIIATPPKNEFFMKLLHSACDVHKYNYDMDYNTLTKQFYETYRLEFGRELTIGVNSNADMDLVLFQETCSKDDAAACMGMFDRYGMCCYIKDEGGTTLFTTRYPDFPWGKCAIIFTMHNETDRTKMYEDVIKYYSNILPLSSLFIVDSADKGISNKLILDDNQIIFKQKKNKNDSTSHELESLRIISNGVNFSKFKWVIKLTCKYKVPELQYFVPGSVKSNLIIQSSGYNSEIIGFKTEYFKDIVKILMNLDGILEERVKLISNEMKVDYFPKLTLEDPKYSRATGEKLLYL